MKLALQFCLRFLAPAVAAVHLVPLVVEDSVHRETALDKIVALIVAVLARGLLPVGPLLLRRQVNIVQPRQPDGALVDIVVRVRLLPCSLPGLRATSLS